jgi:hypothetical protein
MPLKPSDDISTWIKDFQKSDDPRFDGKSKEKRREMAIAAHLSAQREDNKAYNKGVAADKKDDRDAHFDKQAKMSDDDPDAYKPAPGDKDKDGELKKTKVSKHTKKYKQMYGEDKQPIEEKIAGLEKKAKKSGISYGILKQVYDRGMAAWKTGHRPGASQQQWAFARVNSFITKGSGTWGKADKDLAAKVRKEDVTRQELADALEEKKKGLWANMHAKRKRGEAPAKPGDKDYPEKLPEDMTEEKVECPKCKGDGCSHCDDKGYHMQERKSTVPELMQVNIKGEGGVTVRAKTEKEALKIALKKMKIQSRFANDKKFMAKVQIIPAESVEEVGEPLEENKLKNLAIQFADEMNELCKLMKNRKDRVACQTIAKLVEKGNMKGASAAMNNLSKEAKDIVVGSFTSLFGDSAAKKYGITEDTSFYAEYISKNILK